MIRGFHCSTTLSRLPTINSVGAVTRASTAVAISVRLPRQTMAATCSGRSTDAISAAAGARSEITDAQTAESGLFQNPVGREAEPLGEQTDEKRYSPV